MNWLKIRSVIVKEWADTFRNKLVFMGLVLLPTIFTAMPLVMLSIIGNAPQSEMDELGPFLAYKDYFGVNDVGALLVGMASIYIILYLIMPLMLPMMIASDSIVSEKVQKSLEPLLATPISVWELLIGKALAAAAPAVAVTWLAYAIYTALAAVIIGGPVVSALLSIDWLIAILLVAPLLSLLSVGLAIIVSSRVNDTRAAQQIGGLVVLPMMLILIPMFAGMILTGKVFLLMAVVVAILDVLVLNIAVSLFQRETILTRWK